MRKRADTIVAQNPYDFLVKMFAGFKRPENYPYKFDLLVAVAGRVDSPGPRHAQWEFILDAGMAKLQKALDLEPIGAGPHFFIFPDRWLVPGEAQLFCSKLNDNPDANKFGAVYIVTHQPYIVGDCRKEQVRILTV